ncbi:uncharacterized protein DSM5745_06556 [Aspergillus mulundensis]|uniref:Uncharacterized protein n=1 Tax=Aspergillus mulundensis TaxID=1810919 RepID=A0A3D8RRR6_9EURO|nr:hypothetical protein DSM5745_06556 [Aspergillus mulundensis]RDW76564.1 hypothetical protein DSM5745_06556 [Aspergillus mulundensis]
MPTSSLPTLNWKEDSYYDQYPAQRDQRDARIERVNWNALREYVSSKNSGHLYNDPRPEVYGYKLINDNPVRAAFTLMQFIPGSSTTDATEAYKAQGDRVPVEKKKRLTEQLAEIQVQLSSIRLPQIGKVIKRPDGTFNIGPFPSIGGLFSTGSAILEAWAAQAKSKASTSEEPIRGMMKDDPVEKGGGLGAS